MSSLQQQLVRQGLVAIQDGDPMGMLTRSTSDRRKQRHERVAVVVLPYFALLLPRLLDHFQTAVLVASDSIASGADL